MILASIAGVFVGVTFVEAVFRSPPRAHFALARVITVAALLTSSALLEPSGPVFALASFIAAKNLRLFQKGCARARR